MRDLALVEETCEVGFHLGASGNAHAQGKEVTQVFLHKGQMVSVQALLPGFLGPLTFLVGYKGSLEGGGGLHFISLMQQVCTEAESSNDKFDARHLKSFRWELPKHLFSLPLAGSKDVTAFNKYESSTQPESIVPRPHSFGPLLRWL